MWSCFNFQLSWAKGARGPQITWIGATMCYYSEGAAIAGVEVTISIEKQQKLSGAVADMLSATQVDRRKLKEFAGLISWVASVVPSMRPFVAMIWAASSATPVGQETADMVSVARIALPLHWLQAFTAGQMLDAPRRFPVTDPGPGFMLTFDGSLTGGGATLERIASAHRLAVTGDVIEYCAMVWTAADQFPSYD